MSSSKTKENKIYTPLEETDNTKNVEYLDKTKKGVFRKIKTGKKNNYIYEDKTNKGKFKQKQFNGTIEQIYSKELDSRFEQLILNGYDYMCNILGYEINEAEGLFLTERIAETAYFIFLNYILIEGYSNKKQFFLDLKKGKVNKQKQLLKILNLIGLDINDFNNSTSFFNRFTDFGLFELNLDKEKKKEIELIFASELAYIKANIIYNKKLLFIVKEKKNSIGKEVQSILLNLYDYLFLLFYIINFTQELAFILGEKSVQKLKEKMKDYGILLSEEEFLLIIEILIVFYLKGYKKYLYKNYNFIAAINEIVLKVYKELKYKKWVPNKSNFKSWLANWSKNFIKQFITEEVRPIEEEERMATIYSNLEHIITEQLRNAKKEISKENKDDDIKLTTELDTIEEEKEEKEEISGTETEFDSSMLESLKRKAININSTNSGLSERRIEISDKIEKVKRIHDLKRNLENIQDNELKEKFNIKDISKYSKKELINFIKIVLDDINNYISGRNEYILDDNFNKILERIYNLNKLSEIQLYSFLQGLLEIVVGKELPNDINLKEVIQIYLTLTNGND